MHKFIYKIAFFVYKICIYQIKVVILHCQTKNNNSKTFTKMKTILETLEYLQAKQSDVRIELLTFAEYPITDKNMRLLNRPSSYTVNALRRVLNSNDKIKQARIEINNLIH